MEKKLQISLNEMNRLFYDEVADSFSATRVRPWRGWLRLADKIAADVLICEPFRVLDVGCGNMRFERFLIERFPRACFDFTCIDSCAYFAGAGDTPQVRFVCEDIVAGLMGDAVPSKAWKQEYDLVVAFGLMHHIPGAENRRTLIAQLRQACAPEGTLALSFWQFLCDEKLARKAAATMPRALSKLKIREDELESGDAFLGWGVRGEPLRYCHHFEDEECRALMTGCKLALVYDEDSCNKYIIANA